MFFRKKNKIDPSDYNFMGPAIEYCLEHPGWKDPPWSPEAITELNEIEVRLRTELPKAFKEYCLVFGTYDNCLFGHDGHLETLQEQIEPWEVEEAKEFDEFFIKFYSQYPKFKDLPIFEFSNHQGYVSYCFVLNGDDDPECFVVMDLTKIEPVGRFSEYLLNQLKTTNPI